MSDIKRLQARIAQLEKHWPAGHAKPATLTDEEYAGAPVHPSRDWYLRGPPLNERAWNLAIESHAERLAKWRDAKGGAG